MNAQGRRKGETAREYAYRMIREQIISLGLKPGEAFNDMEFAAKIGVSRTPVREAVIQLSEESRIIEIFPTWYAHGPDRCGTGRRSPFPACALREADSRNVL